MRTLEIGLPCSPSKRIESEEIKATEIIITYGGGMGGANKKYYATEVVDNTLTLITGEVVKINPRYVVTERNVTLVKQVIDTTEHSNYHSHTCSKSIVTEYHLLEYGEEYKITDKYIQAKDGKIIYKDIDIN